MCILLNELVARDQEMVMERRFKLDLTYNVHVMDHVLMTFYCSRSSSGLSFNEMKHLLYLGLLVFLPYKAAVPVLSFFPEVLLFDICREQSVG